MKHLPAILFIAAAVLCGSVSAPAQAAPNLDFAVRVGCDFQQPEKGLMDLHVLQGSTPLVLAMPKSSNTALTPDASTSVRMIIGSSATGSLYAVRTNYAIAGGGYAIDWPTIGTNSSGQAWFYTLLFDREGKTYWSGSGSLYIEETTSTASNGLEWIEYTTPNVGWANVVGDPADNAALVQYVEDHGGGSAEDTVARAGVASNSAAIAAVSGRVDTVESWGDHGEAGYLEDAPGTGGPYARQSNGWVAVTVGSGGGASPAPSKSLGASAVGWSILNTNNAPFVTIITDANMGAMLNFPLDTVNAVDAMPIVSDTSASITQLVFVARAYAAGGSEWGTVGLKTTFGGSILTNVITLTNAQTTQTVTLAHAPVSGPCVVPFSWGILPTSTVGTAVGNVRFNVMQARGSW